MNENEFELECRIYIILFNSLGKNAVKDVFLCAECQKLAYSLV